MRTRLAVLALLALAGTVALAAAPSPAKFPVPAHPPADPWASLEPGLALGTFTIGESHGDSRATVHILRVDPEKFRFELLNASSPKEGQTHSAKEWCTRHGLVACINAAMYQADEKTSVGEMKTAAHTNNPKANDDNALFVFDGGVTRLLDRTCDDPDETVESYGTVIQSIRMIDCDGKNVWAPQPKRWSTAAIGMDAAGNILFIHARDPLPVHDLVDGLRGLPLQLARLMYVEGGPEAQLYVHSGGEEDEFLGSYETGFWENDDNHAGWPIPNVVGLARTSGTAGE